MGANGSALTWKDPERDKQLRELLSEGFSSSLIGDKMGLSRNAIIGRAHRLGLTCGNGKHRTSKRRERKAPEPKPVKVQAHMNGALAFQITRAIRAKMLRDEAPDQELPKTAIIDGFRHLTVLELENGDCRFPTGEGAGIRFCGRAQVEGFPYCFTHARMAFRPAQERKGHTKSAHSSTGQFA